MSGPAVAPEGRRTSIVTSVFGALVLLGALIVAFAVFAYGVSSLQEHRRQHFLYEEFRGLIDPSSPVAPPIGGMIPSGAPVALLTVPAAGISNTVVVEGTTPADTLAGPGHLSSSPLPGQFGDSLVFGRSATAGAPFENLDLVRPGDAIEVVTGQGAFRFVVADTRTGGGKFPSVPASGALLTLVTSVGSGGFGNLDASRLLYVDADLRGHASVAPPGRPRTVSAISIEAANDPGEIRVVLLWLAAVAALAVTARWLRRHWGVWQTWIVAVPVTLWVVWQLCSAAVQLLPNVY